MQIVQSLREAIEARYQGALDALAIVEKFLTDRTPVPPSFSTYAAAFPELPTQAAAPVALPVAPGPPPPSPPASLPPAIESARPKFAPELSKPAPEAPPEETAPPAPTKSFRQLVAEFLADGKEATVAEIADCMGMHKAQAMGVVSNYPQQFARRFDDARKLYVYRQLKAGEVAPPKEETRAHQSKTMRQLVEEFLANGREATVQAIADATGITAKQAQGVVSNNPQTFERRQGPSCFHYKLKTKAAAPAEAGPAAAAATIPTQMTIVEETEEQSLERIYATVQLWGIARPRLLAHELQIDPDRVAKLLQHEWFELTQHGYKIRRGTEGSR